MMKQAFLVAGAAVSALVIAGGAVRAENPKEGRRISKLWCSECHVIGSEKAEGRKAPTFKQISEQIPMSETYMNTWLNDPHPPMHRFRLTPRMVADIVAYLKTLKKN